jgi:hypothetical protein
MKKAFSGFKNRDKFSGIPGCRQEDSKQQSAPFQPLRISYPEGEKKVSTILYSDTSHVLFHYGSPLLKFAQGGAVKPDNSAHPSGAFGKLIFPSTAPFNPCPCLAVKKVMLSD